METEHLSADTAGAAQCVDGRVEVRTGEKHEREKRAPAITQPRLLGFLMVHFLKKFRILSTHSSNHIFSQPHLSTKCFGNKSTFAFSTKQSVYEIVSKRIGRGFERFRIEYLETDNRFRRRLRYGDHFLNDRFQFPANGTIFDLHLLFASIHLFNLTFRIRRRQAGSFDGTTDARRAVACIRFVRLFGR